MCSSDLVRGPGSSPGGRSDPPLTAGLREVGLAVGKVGAVATLHLNGRSIEVAAAPDTPLLWVIRVDAGLTGTKYGCGVGVCGACMVHLDGQAAKSCQLTLAEVGERRVTTIEGLAAEGHPVIDAWIAEQVPQCGYCQPGMIMVVEASRRAGHHGKEILSDCQHLCVCGTYQRIKTAVEGL